MSHEITELDRVGLLGEQAWHNLGVVIQDDLTAVQAAERFNLTWPVDQDKLAAISKVASRTLELAKGHYAEGRDGAALEGFKAFIDLLHPVNSHVANMRRGTFDGQNVNELLGVVGSDYQVCQNQELAEFTDALAQTGKVTIESCGSVRGGKRVWFLARGESFNVGKTDEVFPYILVSNGHDGGQAIRVTPTTIRVVCSNTLHMVIPSTEGERPETAAITIRHSGNISNKLDAARDALSHYGDTLRQNRELFDRLNEKKISHEQGMKLFADSYSQFWEVATADELNSSHEKIRAIARNRANRMEKASSDFMARYKMEVEKVGGEDTAWAYFNAMTGYVQHDKAARGSDDQDRALRRRESNLFGVNATRTNDVLAVALHS